MQSITLISQMLPLFTVARPIESDASGKKTEAVVKGLENLLLLAEHLKDQMKFDDQKVQVIAILHDLIFSDRLKCSTEEMAAVSQFDQLGNLVQNKADTGITDYSVSAHYLSELLRAKVLLVLGETESIRPRLENSEACIEYLNAMAGLAESLAKGHPNATEWRQAVREHFCKVLTHFMHDAPSDEIIPVWGFVKTGLYLTLIDSEQKKATNIFSAFMVEREEGSGHRFIVPQETAAIMAQYQSFEERLEAVASPYTPMPFTSKAMPRKDSSLSIATVGTDASSISADTQSPTFSA